MQKMIIGFYIIFGALCSASAYSYEGPYLSDIAPIVRVSTTGQIQIFGTPEEAYCHKNKASYEAKYTKNEEVNMIFTVALAAQVSNRKINVWVERYGDTNPQRCTISFIEIAPLEE